MHDICVIGHVSRDIVRRTGQAEAEQPGGVPYYAGVALARLGLNTAVLTRLATADDRLLAPLRAAGIAVTCRPSPATTAFENAYSGPDFAERRQRVRAVAAPFAPSDLTDIEARAVHLGPITAREMDLPFLDSVAQMGWRVSLDVQGFTRTVDDGAVQLGDWPDKAAALARVEIVKADLAEARVLTGESDPHRAADALAAFGPAEAIVTRGDGGAVICAAGRSHRIAPVAPPALVDPTGAGDSFMAGYLFHRLRSTDIAAAGRFAAALAALALGHSGPFTGGEAEVRDFLRRQSRP